MRERLDIISTTWDIVQEANREWDAAQQPEASEDHQISHDLLVNMAGVALNRDSDNPFNVDPLQQEIATREQQEAQFAHAEALLDHIKDPKIVENLIKRHEIKQHLRSVFDDLGFVEIDTPVLGTAMTEYTKDNFAVRGNAGEYFLPQSPQIYKQALVINTFPRYFQFAKCFRDEEYESTRSDQLHEFMQIDLELRCETVDELRDFAEKIVSEMFKKFGKECPTPFPVMDYREAIARYGTDKPDLRDENNENAFLWVVNFPQFEKNAAGEAVTTHHPFQQPVIEDISDISSKPFEIGSSTFDLVLNGIEIGGGDMRINDYDTQLEVLKVLGLPPAQFALLLKSLEGGTAPSHGGMAIGLDRITMAITDTKKATDVIAFNT